MYAPLSTAAWIAHDLGMAAGFGGPLFGKLALNNAVKELPSETERTRVLATAWRSYNLFDTAALGLSAFTWIAGRTFLSGREAYGSSSRWLTITKDVLMGTTVLSGVACFVIGRLIPADTTNEPFKPTNKLQAMVRTDADKAVLEQVVGALGYVNLIAAAGVIGVTTALAMQASQAPRWKLIAKFLP